MIFVLAALGGVVETSRKKVRLDNEGVYFVRNFRGVRVERSEIGSVTWAAGVGVSLKLLSGAYVPLPEVGAGSQALANTIRAWLKRTCNNGVQ